MRTNGRSCGFSASVRAAVWHASSTDFASSVVRAASSRSVRSRRSPIVRSVSSVTTHSMPPTPPWSSGTGLYEKVWYVSSGNPRRSRNSSSPSSQVACPVRMTDSARGPMSPQISDQTSRADRPKRPGVLRAESHRGRRRRCRRR